MTPEPDTVDIRPAPLTQHTITLTRADACHRDDPAVIALCDVALGRAPDIRDLERLDPGAAESLATLSKRDAIRLLANHLRGAR